MPIDSLGIGSLESLNESEDVVFAFGRFFLAEVGYYAYCNRLLNNFQWPDRVQIEVIS